MAKKIKPEDLGAAIQEELTIYHKGVGERLNASGRKAIKKIVKLTKATAPVGERGAYRDSITSQEIEDGNGLKRFVWGAGGKQGRLTHLLVKGHATRDGGRTKADPFLENALAEVLPEYEEDAEEAVIP